MMPAKNQQRWLASIIILILLVGAFGIYAVLVGTEDTSETAAAYVAAVSDAKTVEAGELLELKTTLTKDNEYAVWDEKGEQVLLCTWNASPDIYPDGADVTVGADPVWVFSGAEMEVWYADNHGDVTDWELRLCQLIGVHADEGYTHMTAMWVDVEDVYRPAYESDPTADTMTIELTGDDWFREWFEYNNSSSYGENGYPWTRLGYTYDWAEDDIEYGLTEFIIRPGAEITVDKTLTTDDYLAALQTETERRIS